MIGFLMVVLVLLMLVMLVAVVLLYLRVSSSERVPVSDAQTAVIEERVAQLAPMAQTISGIQSSVSSLQSQLEARREMEHRTAESVRRLETVIAGTQTKGAAGENILEAVFSRLPVEWQIRNFQVNGKPVEFGLRLPNNLVLPVDSKWTATGAVERFAVCENVDEQKKLKKQIETAVREKAREVKKYIDPNITATFGVAVIPDAAYDACGGLHSEVFKMNVVVISYSMFVPYLLLVFQTTLKNSQSVDVQKLEVYLRNIEEGVSNLQSELNGRFARGMTMLTNSERDMGTELGKINSGIQNLRLSGSSETDAPVLSNDKQESLTQQTEVRYRT